MASRNKEQCPSCFQPIAATDFLCPHCELILDPSQVVGKSSNEVSVVRRMLEPPQRGIPAARPDTKAARPKVTAQGAEGPTKRLDLGPELSGVPVVVATLSKKSEQVTELEAWLVSLIDGLSDAAALAKRANLREFELRVILRTLNEKRIIDFADEPLSDEDLNLPEVIGTLATDENPIPVAPPPPPPAVAKAPSYGANADRRDGRFVAPASRQASQVPAFPGGPPPEPLGKKELTTAPGGPPGVVDDGPPIVSGRAEPPVLSAASPPMPRAQPKRAETSPPYPPRKPTEPPVVAPARVKTEPAPPPERQTDPRIAYTGKPNRKVLDALKQVKRSDGSSPVPREMAASTPIADVLAQDSLQVALRMEQSGRMDEAIRFLEKSIAQSPDAASLYNRLGIILMRERGDWRRAEQAIRKATELAPDNNVYSKNLQQVVSRQALKSAR